MNDVITLKDFPSYNVNIYGVVWNNFTLRVMTPHMNNVGVVCVSLQDENRRQRQRSLAKMMAVAFISKPSHPFLIFDTPINLDYDRWNCAVDNLMWRPRWFAYQYHAQRDFAIKYSNEALIRDLETGEVYVGTWAVCTKFGLLEQQLRRAIIMEQKVFPTGQEFELMDR
jgi:hypothetical protein